MIRLHTILYWSEGYSKLQTTQANMDTGDRIKPSGYRGIWIGRSRMPTVRHSSGCRGVPDWPMSVGWSYIGILSSSFLWSLMLLTCEGFGFLLNFCDRKLNLLVTMFLSLSFLLGLGGRAGGPPRDGSLKLEGLK